MSLKVLFRSVLSRLSRFQSRFQPASSSVSSGATPTDQKTDEPLLTEFASEVYNALSSDVPIELNAPLRFTRTYSGPAFQVNGSDAAIGYIQPDGTKSSDMAGTLRVRIVSVGDDVLTVRTSDSGDPLVIAKPYELRRSTTDQKTINSITYEFSDAQTRTASGTVERITPPYTFGDELVALLIEDGYVIFGTDGQPLQYVDGNAGGKRWKPEDSPSNPADSTRWRILPVEAYTAAIPTLPVTGATNATPIVLTIVGHQRQTGEHVVIQNVEGNTAANGTWEINAQTQRITNATNANPVVVSTAARNGYASGDKVWIRGVRGNTICNNDNKKPHETTNTQAAWYVKPVAGARFDFDFELYEDAGLTIGVDGNGDFDDPCNARVSWADKLELFYLAPRTKNIVTATNASPIVVECTAHGLGDNSYVILTGVVGFLDADGKSVINNTSAVDTWQIDYVDANHFSLNGSDGTSATSYTSGGKVTAAFENFLDPVAGNGTYAADTGRMLVPGTINIAAQTLDDANDAGLQLGFGLRFLSSTGGTRYGVITSLPGTTGFPYEGRPPNMPLSLPGVLTYAGAPLLGDITQLAVSDTSLVNWVTLNANKLPHFGSVSQLPLSQLLDSAGLLQEKWRLFGGSTIMGRYGKQHSHWYGSNAFLVMFAIVPENSPNTDLTPFGLISGGTVTIIPDRQRPYNSFGVHTDGSSQFGALVTHAAAENFSPGHTVTGLKGWTFRKVEVGATPPAFNILETTVVCEGGTGTDFQTDIDSSTDAATIVVTSVGHGLSDGMRILIEGHATNTAANSLHYVNKLTDDTFELYTDSTLSTAVAGSGAGAGTGGFFTHGLSGTTQAITSSTNATPIVVTKSGHGLGDGDKIVILGHATNTKANGLCYVDKLSSSTFALYYDSALTSPVAGNGVGGATGTFVLLGGQCVVESLTLEATAGSRYEIEDLAQGPAINVDVGGQLVSRFSQNRGPRIDLVPNHLVYNSPCELNVLSYDLIFNSRLEVGCSSLGNRPGARYDTEEDPSAAQYLTVFLVFVVE